MTQAPKIKQAMVLAAGLGKRMRPITDTIPKPMVPVSGKTLLDHGLDALAEVGVERAAVNVHYLAEQIEAHTRTRERPLIAISDERGELLDSGGGVKKALTHLNGDPLYILNADSFWIDGENANLCSMAKGWIPEIMDMLLMISPHENAVGFEGPGDFFLDDEGRLTRRGSAVSAPYIYAGAIVAKPELFNAIKHERFSLNVLFDQALASNRLFGMVMDGLWLHVGTPHAIGEAEAAIEAYRAS